MRRKDLEIRDRELLSGMLDLAEILHLAIKNEPFPYIVPKSVSEIPFADPEKSEE